MTVLLGDTADDRSKPLGLKASDNSRTNLAKCSFSSAWPLLHSTCQQTGY